MRDRREEARRMNKEKVSDTKRLPRRCAQGRTTPAITGRDCDNTPCMGGVVFAMPARSVHDILPTEIAAGCERAKMM